MTREPIEWPTRDLLTHRVRATPEQTAVIDGSTGRRWTYREFDARVDAVADRLDALGDGPDARLGLLMDTRVAFAATVFAAMRRAVTVVPLNPRETASELEAKVDRAALDALVCERATESLAVDVAALPIASVDDPETPSVRSLDPASDESEADTAPSRAALDRETTQVIVFTSGTSGEPKGVRLTAGNLVASATASAFRLGVLPDDRWLCCLPMYHMGGLAPVVRSTLYGTTVVVQREFDPGATAGVVDDHGITGVSLVPTMLKRLLDAGWAPPDSLRFVLLGGAPASSDLVARCERVGVPVHPTYGTTETASQITTATPEEAFAHEGTVGHPLAFTDVRVVDADGGEPVEAGESGEIVVDGPTVTPGYLSADRTDDAFGEYGLHTGDVGYRDGDGRLWVGGRVDDRIVTGGENVDPVEVAAVLRAHPEIDEAAVVGLPDEAWGERVAALVVPASPADPPPLEAVLARCDDRLAGFKRPRTIGIAAGLPRTPSGTVDREAVRSRLEGVARDDPAGEVDR